MASTGGVSSFGETGGTFVVSGLQAPMVKPSELLAGAPAASEPISVYTGPTRSGAALIAAVAADADSQTVTRRHGRKSHLAARKSEGEAKSDATSEAKSDAKTDAKSAAKPVRVRHANARTDNNAVAKPADKTAADPSTAKPAKPKAAAKPQAKPAPKSTSGDTKPAG